MRYPSIIFGIISVLFCLQSCGDILEKDLKDDQVELNAPANNLSTATQLQTFWWEELDEVIDGYRLEIVSPNFDSIATLVLREEIVDNTTFDYTLAPGVYQWSIIAFNSTSETAPNIYNLTVTGDSSLNLANQLVNLVSPDDNFATNETELTLLWQMLDNATEYQVQIASPDFSNSTYIIDEQLTTTDSYVTSLSEGDYSWRVRGLNNESVTPYSERSFSIDQTAPTAPLLVSPANGDTISLFTTLNWEVDPESTMDTLYIYEDSLITAPILQIATTNTSYLFNENSSTLYFWRLRSVDAAGNTSDFSALRKFYVE